MTDNKHLTDLTQQDSRNQKVVGALMIVFFVIIAALLLGLTMKPAQSSAPEPETPIEKQKQINDEIFKEYAVIEVDVQTKQAELENAQATLEAKAAEKSTGMDNLKKLISGEATEAVDPREEAKTVEAEPSAEETAPVAVSLDQKLADLGGYLTSAKISSPIPVEVFIDTERRMNCDADLLVAITGADSSYGKNLTTDFNPGNVGNTSGGARRGFDSWQEGVDAICSTLNNQYLGNTMLIGELSNGGRDALGLPSCGGENKCYAHSAESWNRNVLAILSELKGQTIREDYTFRRNA